jgi:hypothetical protein
VAAEMTSIMAYISVLLWMDLSNLGLLAGFSSVFILEAILLKLKLLRQFIFCLILISSGQIHGITNEVQQTPMTINAPQNYLVASISQIQPDQYSTDAQRQQANIVSISAQDLV